MAAVLYYAHQKKALLCNLLFRLLYVCCMLCMLLVPIDVHRSDLKRTKPNRYRPSARRTDDNRLKFNTTWSSVTFRWYHHVCPAPDAKTVRVNADEIADALNLPRASAMDARLEAYGRCVARMIRTGHRDEMARDQCFCQRFPEVRAFLALLVCSAMAYCVQIASGSWLRSNRFWCYVALFGTALWTVVCVVMFFGFWRNWFGQVWLPDELFEQNYFDEPEVWFASIVLAFVYGWLGLIESFNYLSIKYTPPAYAKKSKKVQKKTKKAAAVCKLSVEENDVGSSEEETSSPNSSDSEFDEEEIEKSAWQSFTWPRMLSKSEINEKLLKSWP